MTDKECRYCGDPDFEAELYLDEDEDTAVCRSGGCGFAFDSDEIDPDDLAFGFSIVTEVEDL